MIAKSFFVGMFSITLSVLFSVLPSYADSKTTSGFDYDSENSFEHDSARNSDFHTLRLSVKGMENAGAGVLRVLFSNSEDAFEKSIRSSDDSICKDSEGMSDSVQLVWPKGKAIYCTKMVLDGSEDYTNFELRVPSGGYAVIVYYDENGNNVLDKNLFGKPIELYGFSRDARSAFSSPDFESAVLHIHEDTDREFTIR
jgi:hypothetical protein